MVSFDFLSKTICPDEKKVDVLCIENHNLFRRIYNAFLSGETEENNIVFSENYVPLKFKGNVCFLDDYFRLAYSNSIMKKLYERIEDYCYSEMERETVQLKSHLVGYMEQIVKGFDFDFEFNYEFALPELFKLMNMKPVADNYDVLNALIDYILILNKYAPPKCFVLMNLHLYFSENELDLFYGDMINNHIKLLVIESRTVFKKSINENLIIYDNDFCEIFEN